MSDMDYYQEKKRQHLEDGFCVIENVLPPELLQEMRELTDRLIDAVPEADNEKQRSTGSMIPIGRNPAFAKLATLLPALDAYRQMGFDDVRFTSGYVISKPPHSPPLFWHFDWMGWTHPRSYDTEGILILLGVPTPTLCLMQSLPALPENAHSTWNFATALRLV